MKIKIKYFDDSVEKIKKVKVGDWIDLRARKDVVIPYLEFGLIPLNVAIELPKGYEAIVAPRSSTFKTWKMIQTNSFGVIDETYCGDNDEWMMPVFSLNMDSSKINKGDRVCQFRIVKHQPEFDIIEVEKLGNPDRNGFGSTGV